MFNILIYVIFGFLIFFFTRFILKHFKKLSIGSLCLVSGGVKKGKTTLAVYLAVREHKRAVFKTKLYNFFVSEKKQKPIPLLYSNIPLSVPYVQLSRDLLLRQERFVYGSIIYVSEASLVADSQLIRDSFINDNLLLFNKLIGHETKGGKLIYDTQCLCDLHYSIKRTLSEYFYVYKIVKWLPFFLVMYVKECRYSDDNSVITTESLDTEETLKRVFVPKRVWKKFDCYTYSILTDSLPVNSNVIRKAKSLKSKYIVSFKPNFGGIDDEKNK